MSIFLIFARGFRLVAVCISFLRLVDGRHRRPSTKRFVFALHPGAHDNEAFGRWAPPAPIDQTH